jgi:cytochrome c oxidase subunit 2
MRHATRIAIIWLVASVIVEVLIGLIPIPSPALSSEALGEHQTVYMLFYVGAPIFVFVWVLFAYNLIVFRRQGSEEGDPSAVADSTPILLLWAGLSFLIVLFLAGWGTFTLHEITQQPSVAVASTKSHTHGQPTTAQVATATKPLDIQAIGQEWFWTFRYPSYGGMETKDLIFPLNRPIHFHITSLDVVHSFWMYEYDIKEDAVPGVSNTAWLLAKKPMTSTAIGKNWVKCNELCGLWHGYMHSPFKAVTEASFNAWATRQEAFETSTGLLKVLPRYSEVYYPASNSNWPPAPQDQSP